MKTTMLIILFASLALATQELFSRSGTPPRSPARSRSPERSPSNSRGQSTASSALRISLSSPPARSGSAGRLLTHTNVDRGNRHDGSTPGPRYVSSRGPAHVGVRLSGPGSIYTESGHSPLPNKPYDKKDMFSWAGPHGKYLSFTHPEKLRVHVASAKDGSSLLAEGRRASVNAQAVGASGLGIAQSHTLGNGPRGGSIDARRHSDQEAIESEAWSNRGAQAFAMSSGNGVQISGSASNSPLGSPSASSGNRTPPSPRSPSR